MKKLKELAKDFGAVALFTGVVAAPIAATMLIGTGIAGMVGAHVDSQQPRDIQMRNEASVYMRYVEYNGPRLDPSVMSDIKFNDSTSLTRPFTDLTGSFTAFTKGYQEGGSQPVTVTFSCKPEEPRPWETSNVIGCTFDIPGRKAPAVT